MIEFFNTLTRRDVEKASRPISGMKNLTDVRYVGATFYTLIKGTSNKKVVLLATPIPKLTLAHKSPML